jgi:hypothetical protein
MLKDFDVYLPLMRRPGGIVFVHDVQDDVPYQQFKKIMQRGYRTEVILDRSEGVEIHRRVQEGYQVQSCWEGWLNEWKGNSCGVGVIYL